MIEFFDHTADVGMRVTGRDLDELFTEAAAGFAQVCAAEPRALSADRRRRIRLTADSPEFLLVDWLSELHYLYAAEGLLPVAAAVAVRAEGTRWRLDAAVDFVPLDRRRHRPRQDVKAVTYHRLGLAAAAAGGVRAEVVFDV